MSDWTNIQTIGFTPIFATADLINKKIAYGEASGSHEAGDIYEYDIDTDTQTLILDISNHSDFNSIEGLAYFDEELFALIKEIYGSSPVYNGLRVYKYSGTPDSWNVVDTLYYDAAQFSVVHGRLWTTPSGIVAYGVINQSYEPLLDDVVVYSTDGSIWNDGNVNGFKVLDTISISGKRITGSPHCYKDAYHRFATSITEYSIIKISPTTGNLTEVKAVDTQGYYVTWPETGYSEHWVTSPGYWTADWNTIDDDGDYTKQQLWSAGLEYTLALSDNNYKIYQWDPIGELWSELDDPSGAHTFYSNNSSLFRMVDGDAYLVAYDNDVSGYVVSERDDPISPTSGLRLIEAVGGDGIIHICGNEDGTLKVFTYETETFTFSHEVSAGAATYAEMDSRTRGIFPATNPDKSLLFIYGRDGNDLQIQSSDDYGVSLSDDISGSGWSGKYIVYLGIDPINPNNFIAVCSDDDIYSSVDGGSNWTKINDSPVITREANRHLINESNLILAGQSAGSGQLFFSPNRGLTTDDISDASIGTINHIEVSL